MVRQQELVEVFKRPRKPRLRQVDFDLAGMWTLTPALSHLMGEGETSHASSKNGGRVGGAPRSQGPAQADVVEIASFAETVIKSIRCVSGVAKQIKIRVAGRGEIVVTRVARLPGGDVAAEAFSGQVM